jgi:hypothetical protein
MQAVRAGMIASAEERSRDGGNPHDPDVATNDVAGRAACLAAL